MAPADPADPASVSQTSVAGPQSAVAVAPPTQQPHAPVPDEIREHAGETPAQVIMAHAAATEHLSRSETAQDAAPAPGVRSLPRDSTSQVPSPASQSSPSARQAPATAATSPGAPKRADEAKEKPTGLTITTPAGRRRRDARDVSDGAHTASSTTERPSSSRSRRTSSPPKRAKTSFLARIARICVSCTRPSSREHDIDVDEGATHLVETDQRVTKDSEKQNTVESSTIATVVAPPSPTQLGPPEVSVDVDTDVDVIVPPSPSKLLPESETDGLTSGAVQAPGSTGHDIAVEHRAHTNDSGDDSDGSFTEEDVLKDLLHVDGEAEEQRLIRKGGQGLPIGSDGKPQPLLPPIAPEYQGRKCLVLDLDETLVHSSLRPVASPDYIVPVEIESFWHNFYVLKRPGVDLFLKKMGEIYEVVVFTASLSKYADPVLDRLDPDRSVAHRLFRESCYNHRGNYVKDLSQLGRPVADTIIIDNSPASYLFHPHNAVPVSSWFSDPHDTELTDLLPFLADLSQVPRDVRGILNASI